MPCDPAPMNAATRCATLLALAVRHVPYARQDFDLRRPACQPRDRLRMQRRAVFVVAAVYRERRARHARQDGGERPAGEFRRQPCVDPCIEHPARLLAVIRAQPFECVALLELLARVDDAGARAVFDERLRGFGDQRVARRSKLGRAMHGHSAADAMAERDEAIEAERIAQHRKAPARLVPHEIEAERVRARIRLPEAEAIVSDHAPPGACGQRPRKRPPHAHAAERIVQQHDGRRIVRHVRAMRRGPASREQTPAPGVDPAVCGGVPARVRVRH